MLSYPPGQFVDPFTLQASATSDCGYWPGNDVGYYDPVLAHHQPSPPVPSQAASFGSLEGFVPDASADRAGPTTFSASNNIFSPPTTTKQPCYPPLMRQILLWDPQRGQYIPIKTDIPDFQPMPLNQYTTQESAATKHPRYPQYQLPPPLPTPDTSIFCPNSPQLPYPGLFHRPVDYSQAHLGQIPLQTGYVNPQASGTACPPAYETVPGPPPIPSSHTPGLDPILEPTLYSFLSDLSSPESTPAVDFCEKVGATSETPNLRPGPRPRFPRATRPTSRSSKVRKGKPYARPKTITFVSGPPASRSSSSNVGSDSSVQGRSTTSGSTSSSSSSHNQGEVQELVINEDQYAPWFLALASDMIVAPPSPQITVASISTAKVPRVKRARNNFKDMIAAPSSPEITVTSASTPKVPRVKKETRNNAKDMTVPPPSPEITITSISTPKVPTAKKKERNNIKAHICSGFGPTVQEKLIVTGPPGTQSAPFTGKIEPCIGSPEKWWRCRWDGCRMMTRATQKHIKAHMRIIHGICPPASASSLPARVRKSQTDDGRIRIRCLWHPPLRVQTSEHPDPLFVTSHSHSYECDTEIELSSVINHIGTHLRFERQPNAMAVMCCHKVVMSRGSHACPNTKEETRKREEANEEWVKAFVSAKCKGSLVANLRFSSSVS